MTPLGLADMQEGETGIVVGNHDRDGRASRLAELGLAHGEQVYMIRRGSPMLVRIGESRLCLRSEEAAGIVVCLP